MLHSSDKEGSEWWELFLFGPCLPICVTTKLSLFGKLTATATPVRIHTYRYVLKDDGLSWPYFDRCWAVSQLPSLWSWVNTESGQKIRLILIPDRLILQSCPPRIGGQILLSRYDLVSKDFWDPIHHCWACFPREQRPTFYVDNKESQVDVNPDL